MSERFIESNYDTLKDTVTDDEFKVNSSQFEAIKERLNNLANECSHIDLHYDFETWDNFIMELSDKELELINLKEMYVQLEQEIIDETDFKELYGKNNETVRRNHVKNELKDIVDKRNELEISINYLKRKLDFQSKLVAMKIELIKYNK